MAELERSSVSSLAVLRHVCDWQVMLRKKGIFPHMFFMFVEFSFRQHFIGRKPL